MSEKKPSVTEPVDYVKASRIYHPSHYNHGEIEVIDYLKDKLNLQEFSGFCLGNVIKYISRWKWKGGVEDLKKAEQYLAWAIEENEKGALKFNDLWRENEAYSQGDTDGDDVNIREKLYFRDWMQWQKDAFAKSLINNWKNKEKEDKGDNKND